MIGSTNWVLQHLPEARSRIASVIYIDSVRGPLFGASIVPGLRDLLDQVLDHFTDPNTDKPVREFHLEYGMPGFSDDTMAFTNLAGVPVAQLNYGMSYTMYHSIYDNLEWMNRYCDPGYKYTANLARMVALFSIILTKDAMFPFRFSEFGEHYEKEFTKLSLQQTDFRELSKLAGQISEAGKEIENFDFSRLTKEQRKEVNSLLHRAISSFTDAPGKTAEPFISRNISVGPSPQNECAGVELSGIQRAIQYSDKQMLKKQTARALTAFTQTRDYLQQATVQLKSQN